MTNDVRKPKRSTLTVYIRTMTSTTSDITEYPFCTATGEGYRPVSRFRVVRLYVTAATTGLTTIGGGEYFRVQLHKSSFGTAFMSVSTGANGDIQLDDSTDVTEFTTSQDLLCRVILEGGIGTQTAKYITVSIDVEYL